MSTITLNNNKRIVKNTVLLYFRMIVTMCVSFFTSRVILQTLGVENYGIYNVVGGIVTMFSFICYSLATASQRFITFELGKEEKGNVSNVFSTCLKLHFLLAVIVGVIVEPVGIWFICKKLMIPETRLYATIWVFQFSILSMIVSFVSVPYNALIIAYEKMNAFALVSIVDAGLKLFIAYSLLIFNNADKLIVYGVLMLLSQTMVVVCYVIYCKRVFTNVRYIKQMDKSLFVEMGKFVSWSIFGNISFLAYTQGLNLLLGMFFSPIVNAARGIAVQIQGGVNTFVSSFQTAINPQITKKYASGNISEMIKLVFCSSRFSFYLLMILSVPIILRTNDILSVWLMEVPEYTVVFVRIILITTWINSIANPLIISVKATGKVKIYELTVGGLMLTILPISYIFLRLGYTPEIVFIIHLTVECLAMMFRIWNAHLLIHFSLREYSMEVLFRICLVALVSLSMSYFVSVNMPHGLLFTAVVFAISIVISVVSILLIGLDKKERIILKEKIELK